MAERREGPRDIPTSERISHIGTAMVSNIAHKISRAENTQHGAAYVLDSVELEALIQSWPPGPRKAVEQMLAQYGPPNEGTPVRLIWYRNGPWKRTEITRDELIHNFPAAHTDYITQWIDYQVPVERFTDVARYDGSCLLDRTAGEAGARCDSEAANMITLNLMHEVVIGQRSVDEARQKYAEQMSAYMLGRPAPYAERLLFDPPNGGTVDVDEAKIAGAMVTQISEKVADVIAGEPGNSKV